MSVRDRRVNNDRCNIIYTIGIARAAYHEPDVLQHRHRLDEHVLLMHVAAVTSHVRRRGRRAVDQDLAVHHDAGCRLRLRNSKRVFRASATLPFLKTRRSDKPRRRESYLRGARNASAVISELLPAPLRRRKENYFD